jgi:hypothetical protein
VNLTLDPSESELRHAASVTATSLPKKGWPRMKIAQDLDEKVKALLEAAGK